MHLHCANADMRSACITRAPAPACTGTSARAHSAGARSTSRRRSKAPAAEVPSGRRSKYRACPQSEPHRTSINTGGNAYFQESRESLLICGRGVVKLYFFSFQQVTVFSKKNACVVEIGGCRNSGELSGLLTCEIPVALSKRPRRKGRLQAHWKPVKAA